MPFSESVKNVCSVLVAEMCAASALISMGAVMGKANPVQLVLLALLEVSGFVLNERLLQGLLKVSKCLQSLLLNQIIYFDFFGFQNGWNDLPQCQVRPLKGIMLLHIFGAFFGLTLTWILYRKGSEGGFEKEKFDKKSGLFSMLGEGTIP